jgi:DNA-directed RNA polymerase delta subunit
MENEESNSKTYFFNLAEKMLGNVSSRSREIVRKRFGLSQEKPMTLEKIGEEYGITRERVRQIITEALRTFSKKDSNFLFGEAEDKLVFSLGKNNGIIEESEIVSKLNLDGWKEANAIKFFAGISSKVNVISEKGRISKCWSLSNNAVEEIEEVEKAVIEYLEKKGKTVSEEEIGNILAEKFPQMEKGKAMAILEVLTEVGKNKFGKWGKSSWTEINPKGTREKIHLVMKEEGRPLHFAEIAVLIDKYKLSKRRAHPQTVHNELIKDERFVLIGRGTYAMREWGYSEGTVREVIREILERHGAPMKKEEILKKVFKIRKVKKTTVMINLNNARFFKRMDSRYVAK